MKIFDAHCDVLYKIWENKQLSFADDTYLHVTYKGLCKYPGSIQCMAIFVPPEVPQSLKFNAALEMIDIFYEKILNPYDNIKVIFQKEDIHNLKKDEIGVMLTLEGCDVIDTDLIKLKTLYRLGVRSVGLTWNYANAVADGVLEERGGGLTNFGKTVVKELNRLRLWTDVSHLTERGFYEVLDLAKHPIASHSNAYKICPHPRNLTDQQIKGLIKKNGVVGMNFHPLFLKDHQASVFDILKHIEHICELGGELNIGLGSDFDGISSTPKGVETYEKYDNLINELYKNYTNKQVENFCYHNFVQRFL